MEFLGKIGIDFKILIAQIINFLVLLWFLKKFLYQPIIKNLEERAKKAQEIEEKEKEIQRKIKEMERKEEEIIEKAKQKAQEIIEEGEEISIKERERILRRAEEEMKKILKEAREKAEIEVEKMKQKEKEEILKKAKEIVKKALSESFTLKLHQKYFEEVFQEIGKLDLEKIKKEIVEVTIISAFPLKKEEEKRLSEFFFKKLKNPAFNQKVDPSLIAGIEIYLNGFSIKASLKEKIEKAIYE